MVHLSKFTGLNKESCQIDCGSASFLSMIIAVHLKLLGVERRFGTHVWRQERLGYDTYTYVALRPRGPKSPFQTAKFKRPRVLGFLLIKYLYWTFIFIPFFTISIFVNLSSSTCMPNTAGILSKTPRVTSLLRLNNRFGQSSGCVVCTVMKQIVSGFSPGEKYLGLSVGIRVGQSEKYLILRKSLILYFLCILDSCYTYWTFIFIVSGFSPGEKYWGLLIGIRVGRSEKYLILHKSFILYHKL